MLFFTLSEDEVDLILDFSVCSLELESLFEVEVAVLHRNANDNGNLTPKYIHGIYCGFVQELIPP